MTIKSIPVQDAHEKIKNKENVLIDVRTQSEFEDHHINGSVNIPLDNLLDFKEEIKTSKKQPIFVCKSGSRSSKACELLQKGVLDEVYSLEGGIDEWKESNFEINYGKKHWSLERQVRFTAGTLIVIGIIGNILIHDNFKFLSLFIGIGLIFAAITNTCGLGILLSKMPWNQIKEKEKYKKQIEKILKE